LLRAFPDEIGEVYFGVNATAELKSELSALALEMNPAVDLFQGFREAEGTLVFRKM